MTIEVETTTLTSQDHYDRFLLAAAWVNMALTAEDRQEALQDADDVLDSFQWLHRLGLVQYPEEGI